MQRIYENDAYGAEARKDCFWELPKGNWPEFEGDRHVEHAIIGGGFTGLSAALHLAEAGAEALVLEAQSPGWGASGRNGGFCCLGGAMLGATAMRRRYGVAETEAFQDAERAAVRLVADLLEHHRIDAQTHSNGEVELAHRPAMLTEMAAEVRVLGAKGIEANLLSREDLEQNGMAGPHFYGGLHIKEGFALNPARYVGGLAEAAQKAGAEICADSPVTGITPQNGRYVLKLPKGRVIARHLILATNGYSSEDVPEWLRARYLPLQSNILVTRPLTMAERVAQGWSTDLMAYDSRRLLHYFRLLPDGRFLFGMRGGVRADGPARGRMQATIRQDFERLFPAWVSVETPHFWSGLICIARKRVPYVGVIEGWENAWTGLAYHGNGVAMGSYAGALLADLALGKGSPGRVFTAPLRRFPLGAGRRVLVAPAFTFYGVLDGR